jgi:hypothetical protein
VQFRCLAGLEIVGKPAVAHHAFGGEGFAHCKLDFAGKISGFPPIQSSLFVTILLFQNPKIWGFHSFGTGRYFAADFCHTFLE